ncbi:hypothetical protein [Streptomyces sp. NPDC005548]|uniref:hypothetical protein n=1 Tax=Streptomyces sp. NPDC005548 TaxID=3364724 RepID=UPI00367AD313
MTVTVWSSISYWTRVEAGLDAVVAGGCDGECACGPRVVGQKVNGFEDLLDTRAVSRRMLSATVSADGSQTAQ